MWASSRNRLLLFYIFSSGAGIRDQGLIILPVSSANYLTLWILNHTELFLRKRDPRTDQPRKICYFSNLYILARFSFSYSVTMQVKIRKQHSKDRIISFGQIVVKSDCFETKIIQNIQFSISVSKEQSTHKGNVFIHKKIKHKMSMKLVRHKDERTDLRKKKIIILLSLTGNCWHLRSFFRF